MKNKGITLVELLIIISIIGILIVAMGFSYQGWMGRYRIESQTKELYSDLMEAKTRAMTRHRIHFVILESTRYAVYDDNNPSPDGNGTLETDSDDPDNSDERIIPPKKPFEKPNEKYQDLKYDLKLLPVGSSSLPVTITIDTRGLMFPQRDFRIDNDINPDYDCIMITQARIRMGKWENNKCREK